MSTHMDTNTGATETVTGQAAARAKGRAPIWRGDVPADLDYGYQDLARLNPSYSWWRPLATTFLGRSLSPVVLGLIVGFGVALTGRQDYPGFPEGSAADAFWSMLEIMLFIPALWLGLRWFERRGMGTLSSVFGHLRWKIIFLGVGMALVGFTVLSIAQGELGPLASPNFAAIGVFMLTIPLQASAEEYLFRGAALQAVAAWTRSGWVAVIVSAVLFMLSHPQYNGSGIMSTLAMGLVCGYLAIRTGGLEAGIALHVVNNVFAGPVGLLFGDDGTADTGTTWVDGIPETINLVILAALIEVIGRRLGLFTPRPVFRRSSANLTRAGVVGD